MMTFQKQLISLHFPTAAACQRCRHKLEICEGFDKNGRYFRGNNFRHQTKTNSAIQ